MRSGSRVFADGVDDEVLPPSGFVGLSPPSSARVACGSGVRRPRRRISPRADGSHRWAFALSRVFTTRNHTFRAYSAVPNGRSGCVQSALSMLPYQSRRLASYSRRRIEMRSEENTFKAFFDIEIFGMVTIRCPPGLSRRPNSRIAWCGFSMCSSPSTQVM